MRLVCILDVHGHSCSCDRTASCSFQRDNRALARGSGWQAGQHAARPSTWQSPALAVVGSATGTSWRPCGLLIASRTPPASKSRATAKIFRWRGGMHAEIASFRSLTGGKRRIGTALPQRGVCAMFGEAGSVHDGVCTSDRSAADFGRLAGSGKNGLKQGRA